MKGIISRVRRNHGLEHATLNLLSAAHPRQSFAGHSDGGGFWIIGEVDIDELVQMTSLALKKLSSGQTQLAIHQNCGTNLLVSGFAAGLAGAAGMIGAGSRPRDKLERIPLVTTLSVIALILAKPLGPVLQEKITVGGKPGSLHVKSIEKHTLNGIPAHRVNTQD
jgi:hypothetical protein